MNKRPLNPITAEHRKTYLKDGVVHLRRMFDRQWIERLRRGVDRLLEDPEKYGVPGPSHGASMASLCFMWRRPGVFRDFALNSPVGEAVGRVIGSDTIRLYHDHLFHKPPRLHQSHGLALRPDRLAGQGRDGPQYLGCLDAGGS